MVGGGSRRDDGPLNISSTNVFAALETLKKKKKKSSKESKGKGSSKSQAKEPEPQVFWAPTPLTVKSWADVDDDDDYFATTAPPQSVWGSSGQQQQQQQHKKAAAVVEEESESEDDGLDIGDDDAEEEPEHEAELAASTEPVMEKPVPVSVSSKDAERHMSKKELKKKEMAELDAILNELGISSKDSNAAHHETNDKKQLEQSGDGKHKESAGAPSEGKSSKKKKAKKEKSSKDTKEQEQQLPHLNDNKSPDESVAEPREEDAPAVDVKERLKKVTSTKKKKSNRETDAAAKAAAVEAAARSARLAAAKKKEKSHYNQQPVR
ncbi:DNA polymerase delta subunit 3-like [Musa acuminata AAA Group]|uniref:DNA polymerase delta subunit 3 n=1 Tax=Musa acuminata AAA Group TaxID=214697 RepID=UPI0031E0D8C2